MAKVTRNGDEVVLTLSVDEALYVTAELGGGNSYFHGIDRGYETPFTALAEALRVGASRRGPHAAKYRKHQRVTVSTRPNFSSRAGRKAGVREGFIESE